MPRSNDIRQPALEPCLCGHDGAVVDDDDLQPTCATRSDAVLLRLTEEDHRSADSAVLDQAQAFSSGPYGRRSAARQRTGRLGECALADWIELRSSMPVRRMFEKPSQYRAADLLVGRTGVEIKSARASSWSRYGATVSAPQLPKIRNTARVVAFVVVADGDLPTRASLLGWLPTQHVHALAEPVVVDDLRAQLLIGADALLPPADLLPAIEDELVPPVEPVPPSACTHCGGEQLLGSCWRCAPAPGYAPRWVTVTPRGRRWHHEEWTVAKRLHPEVSWFEPLEFPIAAETRTPCLLCVEQLLIRVRDAHEFDAQFV